MKQLPTEKKLSLEKETIAALNTEKMYEVKGGISWTHCYISCYAANCEEES